MRKKTITYDPTNYQRTPKVIEVYGKDDQKIRSKKVVETKRKIKTVVYGPVNRTGKQKKTKSKIKK